MINKIVRSVCLFTDTVNIDYTGKVKEIVAILEGRGYQVQTKRIGTNIDDLLMLEDSIDHYVDKISIGKKQLKFVKKNLKNFHNTNRISLCLDFDDEEITIDHVEILFDIITNSPTNTFNFSYGFNIPNSSPFFNCTNYETNGFSIGLQTPNLSKEITSLEAWLSLNKDCWNELEDVCKEYDDFLGIDSSVAPLFDKDGSIVNFIKRLGYDFSSSVTTDVYTRITRFIKEQNPKPVGMNGLMFPALEDFELADEYQEGKFSIERNIFLSLHSGLGVDTYPIGINEDPLRVVEILKLVQALSSKYNKHLAVRFVSDGKTKIGGKSDFKNQYLKDVVIRAV